MAKHKSNKAKKKAKKVVKKKAPKKKAKAKPQIVLPSLPVVDPAVAYTAQKLIRIRKKVPKPPQSGTFPDPENVAEDLKKYLDRYPYCRAEQIFDTYYPLMDEENLVSWPGEISHLIHISGWILLGKQWLVIDADTGLQLPGWAPGYGTNGAWAPDSADTISKKNFLLKAFNASWTCDVELAQLRWSVEEGITRNTPEMAIQAMRDFFGRSSREMSRAISQIPEQVDTIIQREVKRKLKETQHGKR